MTGGKAEVPIIGDFGLTTPSPYRGGKHSALTVPVRYTAFMQKNETPRRFIRLLAVRYTVESDTVDSWQEFEEVDERGLAVPATDEVVDCDDLTLAEVARVVLDHGCSEFCGRWWGDPDGSFTVDYGTAMQEERSAHPEGFSDRERSTIDDLIQGRSTPSYPGVA